MNFKKFLHISLTSVFFSLALSGCSAIHNLPFANLVIPDPIKIQDTKPLDNINTALTKIATDNNTNTGKAKDTLVKAKEAAVPIIDANPNDQPLHQIESIWEATSASVQGYISNIEQDTKDLEAQVKSIEAYKNEIDTLNGQITASNKQNDILKKNAEEDSKNFSTLQTDNTNLRAQLQKEKEASDNWIYELGICIGIFGIVLSVVLFYLTKSLELLLLAIGCSITLIVSCLTLQMFGTYFVIGALIVLVLIVGYGLYCLYTSTKANDELVIIIDYLKANLPQVSYDTIFGTNLAPGLIESLLSPSSQKIIDALRAKNVKLDNSLTPKTVVTVVQPIVPASK